MFLSLEFEVFLEFGVWSLEFSLLLSASKTSSLVSGRLSGRIGAPLLASDIFQLTIHEFCPSLFSEGERFVCIGCAGVGSGRGTARRFFNHRNGGQAGAKPFLYAGQ